MSKLDNIKADFPLLAKDLVYLDSASTTQTPKQVLDKANEYYLEYHANIHRGVYDLSQTATDEYENARKKLARLINCKDNELVFTRGTTESINLVMRALEWKAGDEIVTTVMEHHSNIVPWLHLKKYGVQLKFIPVNLDGTLNLKDLDSIITSKTKLVAVSQASNVMGTIIPIEEIAKVAKQKGALMLVDGAQSVPHFKVDVRELGCDFLAFSGHKMLGPTGIGALYINESVHSKLLPFQFGGDMIKSVRLDEVIYADMPFMFEAGTPNIAGAIGLGAAADYLNNIGFAAIQEHEFELTAYALEKITPIKGVTCFGPNPSQRTGIVSFSIDGMHPHDIGSILNDEKVCIRTGHHCAQPLMEYLGVTALCRASFYFYNSKCDIDRLVDGIKTSQKIFKL